jgi:hypothetical protein
MLERYFIPIAPYLFMAAGLSLCMYVFYSLKREIHCLRTRLGEREAQIDAASGEVRAQIEEMRAELRDAEQRTAQLVPPAPPKSGLNLSVRTQVIRMFRHGEDAESIASRLGLPKNEVVLLLKVHNLAVTGSTGQSAGLQSGSAPVREAQQLKS